MKDIDRQTLDRQLAQLQRDVVPPRSLWPAIAQQIRPAPRRTRPVLLAACVAAAAACLASVFTWAVLRRASAPDGLPMVAGAATFAEPEDPKYIKARDSLRQSFRERLALLDPATRAKIESSLAVIRQAHENIRRALLADPASPVLEELWQSTWHDEIDLYDRLVDATQPSVRT
jgi:hypothetical protein